MNHTIKITLWNHTVGYLTWDDSNWRSETSVFKFDSDFLNLGLDISPLQLSINNPARLAGIPYRGGSPKNEFQGLPPVFADSLPDHWGNSIFRAWAASRKISMKKFTPVDFLSFVGTRAMGALEYHPAIIQDEAEAFDVNVTQLYDFAKSVLNNKKDVEFSSDRELLWEDLVKLGTSPGGKRPKALIAINHETNVVKSGQTLLPEGYEHYILKYDNEKDTFPYARMEYIYYCMCKDLKINMTETFLKSFDSSTHFITKRFDRLNGEKIHMQSLRAMTGGAASSYEDIFNVMKQLKLDYVDFEQLFRRMVFNVAAGNIDDHDRNFSFLMSKDGVWSLSPAYDMVYSIDPATLEIQKGQFLSINGKKNNITSQDLIAIARKYDINRPNEIIANTLDVVSALPEYMKGQNIDPSVSRMVMQELEPKLSGLKTKSLLMENHCK